VMSGNSPLNDSLHVKRSLFNVGVYEGTAAGTAESPRATSASDKLKARRYGSSDSAKANEEESEPAAECVHAAPNGGGLPLWGDQMVHLLRFTWTRPRPSETVIFARSAVEEGERDTTARRGNTAAAGFPLGRGRVVVLSDGDLVRNDVLRVCHWGLDVVTARMLEYLAVGDVKRDRLVFDEYHQGFGTHPGTMRAIAAYLVRAPSGHVLLQALLGGLVLLLALGPRALPAHDAERVERRSPLEHVTALAQAYARVGGTRTATSRLLRGVRRRVERGARGDGSLTANEGDARFLTEAATNPALADDVALVRRALGDGVSPRELEAVGGALQRIEQSLLTQRR